MGLRHMFAALLLASAAGASDLDSPSDSPSPSLLESLWQTFKQTMELTSPALSAHTSSRTTNEPERRSKARSALSSRRIALVKKTLQDHYTQMLVDSSPHWDEVYAESSRAKTEAKSRQDHRNPLRWRVEGKSDKGCYFFSESPGAYWSFQWCRDAIVMQGIRTSENEMTVKHLLGSYVPFQPAGALGARDYAQKFAREAQTWHPNARIELFQNGDPCGKSARGIANRRLTVVLYHDKNSKFCAGDWADDLTDLAIESVEEPFECHYLMHVCGPPNVALHTGTTEESSPMESNRRTITQSDAQGLNQTIAQIQASLQTYLRESSADAKRKANPDRTTSLHIGLPPLPQSRIQSNLKLVREMFQHAYDSYMYNAFPASEIKPMTCQPATFDLVRIPGLTLIDSLDTLISMGNYTEFARAVERLRSLHKYLQDEGGGPVHGGLFALNQNVSVFETNIRVLGGLLAAHQMAEAFLPQKVLKTDVWDKNKEVLIGSALTRECDADDDNEQTEDADHSSLPKKCSVTSSVLECQQESSKHQEASCKNNTLKKYWKYDGILLDLAVDIGDRLLPAFSTKTGIPYGTVNLLSGIPRGETTIASLAGGGTLTLEMELLSRLTGVPEYGNAAKLATRALWMRRSKLDLLGKHICTHRGEWTETLSGIGSNSDSFYEYLIKHHILFPEDDDFWLQLVSTYGGVYNQSRLGEWYGDVDSQWGQTSGTPARRVFEALMAFYPGMQVLLGELTPAARSLNSFFLIREHLGFLPERFSYAAWRVDTGGGHHFLRPELLESAYFMHRASKGFTQSFRNGTDASRMDASGWQWAADFGLHALEEKTRAVCGYASLKSVSSSSTGEIVPGQKRHPSSHNMMDEMPSFFLSETLKYLYLIFDEDNVLHKDKDRDWVFTTEAHPIHHEDFHSKDGKPNEILTLRERLIEKLKSKVQETSPPSRTTSRSHDKWTDSSSPDKFFNQAAPIAQLVESNAQSRLAVSDHISHGPDFWVRSQIVEPLLSASQVSLEMDFFRETQNKQNAAHLTFSKLGNQLALTNSCPNFYLPDWRWLRAVNGGASDYSDAYVSSAMDNPSYGDNHFHSVGSLDALAFFGSGVHVASMYGESAKCPIVDSKAQNSSNPSNDVARSKDTFDMGGELGQFEVSAFPEGSGFYIQRSDSGETLVTTLFQDEASGDSYVMVYATSPVDSRDDGTEYSSPDLDNEGTMEKSVIMADLYGNSFACQIELLLRPKQGTAGTDDCGGDCQRDAEELMAAYPCAAAMFGPTHMNEMAKTDGLTVESTVIRSPDVKGGYGCDAKVGGSEQMDTVASWPTVVAVGADGNQMYIKEESKDDVGSINLVHRGACTFEDKAIMQKTQYNAKGVIVINSEDDELFVMSGGESSEPLKSSELPATVLITGADGKDLCQRTESMKLNGELELFIRISTQRDQAQILEAGKTSLSVHGNRFWPAVRARREAVQVFAKGGWAVHAIQTNNEKRHSKAEWQLFLLRHDIAIEPQS